MLRSHTPGNNATYSWWSVRALVRLWPLSGGCSLPLTCLDSMSETCSIGFGSAGYSTFILNECHGNRWASPPAPANGLKMDFILQLLYHLCWTHVGLYDNPNTLQPKPWWIPTVPINFYNVAVSIPLSLASPNLNTYIISLNSEPALVNLQRVASPGVARRSIVRTASVTSCPALILSSWSLFLIVWLEKWTHGSTVEVNFQGPSCTPAISTRQGDKIMVLSRCCHMQTTSTLSSNQWPTIRTLLQPNYGNLSLPPPTTRRHPGITIPFLI